MWRAARSSSKRSTPTVGIAWSILVKADGEVEVSAIFQNGRTSGR